ncbi:MAG TPA: hemerythrin domain-containing protein [Candidatus Acidoferrales bacterium]|nr:hemerythrin domain-containing protein [Candidatus Acidoferrales bacterium]
MSSLEKLHTHHSQLIGAIKSLADRAKETPTDASLLLSYCEEYLVPHAEAEELTLYAADDDLKFVNDMIREHKEIKHGLDMIEATFGHGDVQLLRSQIDDFLVLLGKHFSEEENILIARLGKKLSEQELDSLIEKVHHMEKERKKSDVWSLFELDHRRIDLNISSLRAAPEQRSATRLYSKTRAQLLKHIELEETLLFPSFGDHATPEQMRPVRVMISEHREIVSCISTPADKTDVKTIHGILNQLIGKLATHNKKEELILYPLINSTLPHEDRYKIFKGSLEQLQTV